MVGRSVPALFAASVVIAVAVAVAEPASARPMCLGKPATIIGTNGVDDLRGTRRADVIFAKGGPDDVKGKGGKDRVCGGDGDDLLEGGRARDRFDGGSGIDDCIKEEGEPHAGCEPQLLEAVVSPTSVVGGQSSTLEAQLDGPAPEGGLVVQASSNNALRATAPAQIPVAAGEDSGSVPITTTPGPPTGVTFTVVLGRRADTAGISLLAAPPALDEFSLHSSCANAVGQADHLVGQVALDRFATRETIIQVTSSNPAVATVNGEGVTIPQGNLIGVVALTVLSAGTTTLTASLDEVQIQRTFEARNPGTPVALTSLDLNPSTVVAGQSSIGTVGLDCASGGGGTEVELSHTGSPVDMPGFVLVPAGRQTATFQMNTPQGIGGQSTISATLGATTLDKTLTITE